MAQKILAMTSDGRLTYCTASPEERGKGRCNHVAHIKEGQTQEDFLNSVSELLSQERVIEQVEENPDVDAIEEGRQKLYELLGTTEVTKENLLSIINGLDPQKQEEVIRLGFQYAYLSNFTIDLNEEEKTDLEKIRFSNMHEYGLGAKKKHIDAIFNSVGTYVTENGDVDIKGNYRNGLSDDEYWSMLYATRKASVNKTVSIAVPGAEARYLYYGLSDTYIMDECNNPNSSGILECSAPGGFCECCANKSGMKRALTQLKKEQKDGGVTKIKIGGLISSNVTEPLTQLYLDSIHGAGSNTNGHNPTSHTNIISTFECYSSNPLIKKAAQCKTTAEKRKVLADGLKELYEVNGIKIDPYNIDIVVKKMTSYKKTPQGLKLINEDKGEVCDVISIRAIGNASNSLYKKSALTTSFKILSKGGKTLQIPSDSFNDISKTNK